MLITDMSDSIAIYKLLRKINKNLELIFNTLVTNQELETQMSVELDNLTLVVNNTKGVIDSAIALLNGIVLQLKDLKGDPAAEQKLADDLQAKTNELASAIAANS